jgi:hypothetical protein
LPGAVAGEHCIGGAHFQGHWRGQPAIAGGLDVADSDWSILGREDEQTPVRAGDHLPQGHSHRSRRSSERASLPVKGGDCLVGAVGDVHAHSRRP